jgi:hypothetical protein
MTQTYEVTATLLNVRRAPAIEPGNIIGKIGQGQRAEGLANAGPNWLQIKVGALQGFAATQFLQPVVQPGAAPPLAPPPAQPIAAGAIPPPAHFSPNASASLSSTSHRHCPLSLPQRLRQNGQSATDRSVALHSIVTDLNVASSARYLPGTQTYCNIYAYDFCYVAGVYLPRVWWNSKALLALAAGQTQDVIYDKTVRELTANALHRWLGEWGDDFGWQPVATLTDLQSRANAGDVCLITAERMDPARSGHIVIVMPENAEHPADRTLTGLRAPLQSQAGRTNKAYFTSRWWTDPIQYRGTGFWAHA